MGLLAGVLPSRCAGLRGGERGVGLETLHGVAHSMLELNSQADGTLARSSAEAAGCWKVEDLCQAARDVLFAGPIADEGSAWTGQSSAFSAPPQRSALQGLGQMQSDLAKALVASHGLQEAPDSIAELLWLALQGECQGLNGGPASKSGAKFEVTADGAFALKILKSDEASILQKLHEKQLYEAGPDFSRSLILPIWLVSPSHCIALMPNLKFGIKQIIGDTANIEKFDVKHIEAKSAERTPLFKRIRELGLGNLASDRTAWCGDWDAHERRRWRHGTRCWESMVAMIRSDLEFFTAQNLIDYSVVFHLASVEDLHVEDISPPSSGCLITARDGHWLVLCVHVIDYLMEKTVSRDIESIVKGLVKDLKAAKLRRTSKFSKYGNKTLRLFECVGDSNLPECQPYLDEVDQEAARAIAARPDSASGRAARRPADASDSDEDPAAISDASIALLEWHMASKRLH